MKKHLLIAGLICMATIPPAVAVTKCVKLSLSTTCSSSSGEYAQSNWSATCGDVPIQGIAFCGSQNGGSTGATTDAITNNSADNKKYCWCKMVSPAVSRWVLSSTISLGSSCAHYCARYCANYAANTASFRSAMFGSLSD